jgi:hypothetical protein
MADCALRQSAPIKPPTPEPACVTATNQRTPYIQGLHMAGGIHNAMQHNLYALRGRKGPLIQSVAENILF